jgi:DNA-binding transcriptional MerR regulator
VNWRRKPAWRDRPFAITKSRVCWNLQLLQIVRVSQSLGFTLEAIRGFLVGEGECDHARVLAQIAVRTRAAQADRAALDMQLAQLAALETLIEGGGADPAATTGCRTAVET